MEIEMSGNILVLPDDWVVLNGEKALSSKRVWLIEILGAIEDLPAFVVFADSANGMEICASEKEILLDIVNACPEAGRDLANLEVDIICEGEYVGTTGWARMIWEELELCSDCDDAELLGEDY